VFIGLTQFLHDFSVTLYYITITLCITGNSCPTNTTSPNTIFFKNVSNMLVENWMELFQKSHTVIFLEGLKKSMEVQNLVLLSRLERESYVLEMS
jgi:hypothetical protein